MVMTKFINVVCLHTRMAGQKPKNCYEMNDKASTMTSRIKETEEFKHLSDILHTLQEYHHDTFDKLIGKYNLDSQNVEGLALEMASKNRSYYR